jgi:hypothetical protein
MMKWVEPKIDLMVFNVGSLIRARSCEVFCFVVICVWLKPKTFCAFCHSYVALVLLQEFLGHVHCSKRSILFCFTSNMFSFVVGFLFGFKGQLLIFYECNYVQSILVSYLTCALRTFVICDLDDLSNINCLKTQF